MPHSNFKDKAYEFNSGIGKCPCGQTFEYTSERDMKMKLQMHLRFCSNPPKGFNQIGILKKSCKNEKSSQLISIHLDKYYHS